MRNFLLALLLFAANNVLSAQIPDGSIAPNFTGLDLNGKNHNLYAWLDSGYMVFVDVSATWCAPCWNYHNTGSLEQLYNEYGPFGSNEVRVLFVEGDGSTNQNCLYGSAGCVGGTQGNWVAGTPYPIIHAQGPSIANAYQISGYPTIFCICPFDRKVYEAGQLPGSSLYDFGIATCAPSPLVVAPQAVIPIKCYNNSTGAIDITPSGGVTPYTYLWSNGATTQDLANLPAGTYTVTVTGKFGTQGISDPIEVEGPSGALSLALDEFTAVGCNGNLGSATVSASGGWSENYTYEWQNGQDGPSAYGLNPGNHIVSVSDDKGCKVNLTVHLAPVVYPTALISEPGIITCNSPVLQLNGTGSSAGSEFEYQWFATNGGVIVSGATGTTPKISAAGNYSIRVTNTETTCVTFAGKAVSANVTLPAADAGPIQNISCTVPQTNLQGTASSGPDFSYVWTTANGGNILSGGTTLNPLVDAVGDYVLKVTNSANGCTQSSATSVTGTPAPVLKTAGGAISCLSAVVTLVTSSNALRPAYAWTGPNGFISAQQSPAVNVTGAYQVMVTDSTTSCTSTATANVTINTAVPGASATGNILTCSIHSATISAGTPDTLARFAWTGPNGFTSTLQSPVISEAGTYSLVVTDTINGCTSTASAIVSLNVALPAAAIASAGNLNCNTSQLQLDATGSAQGANFSYAWTAGNGGHIISGENTQTPLVDAVGTYTLLVTDAANGCTQSVSTGVNQSPAVSAGIVSQSNVLCFGAANGQATATGLGGNGSYTYAWSNGNNTAAVSGLSNGVYVVVVTDGEHCSASTSVVLTQPDPLSVNANAGAQTAFGLNDGTASASVTGGMPGYSFAWDNGASTPNIYGLAPGNYSVIVTDSNGCSAVQTVTVNAFNCILSAQISGTDLLCHASQDGSASVAILAGADPLQYSWSNGASTASLSQLSAGLYTVTLIDGNDCPAVLSVLIHEPLPLVVHIATTVETALSANDGSATAHPSGGTGAYTYSWNTGASTQTIDGLLPGTYTVQVWDENGCLSEQSVELPSYLCAIAVQETIVPVTCAAAANGSVTLSLNGGATPFNYAWSNGGNTPTIAGLSGGLYTVEVTDANGCSFSHTFLIPEPEPFTALDLNIQHPLCPNDPTGVATASISGGTLPYSYLWSNGTTGNILSGAQAGNYTVQVTDANGCKVSVVAGIQSTDHESPVVSAQDANIFLNNNGEALLTLADLGAQFFDNCGVSGTSIEPAVFDCNQIGQQIVTLTVSDLSGNIASTSVLVHISDQIAPVLTCPDNQFACAYAPVIIYAPVILADNCLLAGAGSWTTSGPASGAVFPEGTTTVSYTYTDAGGNTGFCSFEVNIGSPVTFTNLVLNYDVNGQHTGSIDLSLAGGTAPYQFEWTDENVQVIALTEDVAGLGAGVYRVQVTDANGCVFTKDNIILLQTSKTLEPVWLSGLQLLPNPARDMTQLVFNTPAPEMLEISVSDATGKRLFTQYSEGAYLIPLDCSPWPAGVYTLQFRTGLEYGVRKLVISK